MNPLDLGKAVQLQYCVAKYSSYSAKFAPENILQDKPNDQTSRWSSDSHVPPQYLLLKLENPCIVTSITFGKYEKSHVCNVKKIQVWGGLTENHLLQLLDCGLKNDSVAENFPIKHSVCNTPFPVKYIKLLPLQAWGSTFNFSLWCVKLMGCTDSTIVRNCMHMYTLHVEREALRICLKHLRHKKYKTAFEALSREANTSLEHPILSELYSACTEHEETDKVEHILKTAAQQELLQEYLYNLPLIPVWKQLLPAAGSAHSKTPGMRGGHQLSIDTATSTIYLFGGWDGQQDLSDLWSYNITSNEWTCVSQDTTLQGGPSARSCHKMCLDSERRQLFTIGRYVDNKMRSANLLKSDFYMYELDSGQWTLISEDTKEEGGPKLVFDHQIVMDCQERVLYVFGGRVLTLSRWEGIGLESDRGSGFSPAEPMFSGLFKYHVATNTWTCLREDQTPPVPVPTAGGGTSDTGSSSSSAGGSMDLSPPTIKSRVGHSMLFDPTSRHLFVLAGQRNKEYLTDFFTYQIDTDRLTPITDQSCQVITSSNGSSTSSAAEGGALLGVSGSFPYRVGAVGEQVPTAGFTQKSTIDPLMEEVHVLSGLSKEKEKRDMVCNSFWVYSIPRNKWSCIYHNELSSDAVNGPNEPCPRFAHQLVYDHVNKVHYMFGGNPGRQTKMRLDDFWSLSLQRPNIEKLLKEAFFAIRKNRFEELAVEDSTKALVYLQTKLHEVVDHTNHKQVTEFQDLSRIIFKPADPQVCHPPPLSSLHIPLPTPIEGFEDILPSSGENILSSSSSFYHPLTNPPNGGFEEPPSLGSDTMDTSSSTCTSPLLLQQTTPLFNLPKSSRSFSVREQLESWKHTKRSELFNDLTKYFPQSMTQPKENLMDLINL